jgi:hypothetical protein
VSEGGFWHILVWDAAATAGEDAAVLILASERLVDLNATS